MKKQTEYPIVTKQIQKDFMRFLEGAKYMHSSCGKFGATCKYMDDKEGARDKGCAHCPLAEYTRIYKQ